MDDHLRRDTDNVRYEADADNDDRRREIRQLRKDIEILRVRLHTELVRGADRHLVAVTAKLLREKTERLEWLEAPLWIE